MAHSVRDAMALCGLNNVNLFHGQTQAQRVASEVFGDDFHLCRDKTGDELKEDVKAYTSLTIAQGQIRFNPGVRKNLRAFLQ